MRRTIRNSNLACLNERVKPETLKLVAGCLPKCLLPLHHPRYPYPVTVCPQQWNHLFKTATIYLGHTLTRLNPILPLSLFNTRPQGRPNKGHAKFAGVPSLGAIECFMALHGFPEYSRTSAQIRGSPTASHFFQRCLTKFNPRYFSFPRSPTTTRALISCAPYVPHVFSRKTGKTQPVV
ncbi:unnamed protein product [Ectocarpus sp. 6 AP-2014]